MDTWIDNTGLRGAGNALDKRASHSVDVEGLLQLLTQLIFSRKLYVNAFEPNAVVARTREIVEHFEYLGLEARTVVVTLDHQEAYEQACAIAAANCAMDLPSTMLPDPRALEGLALDIRIEATQEFLDLRTILTDSFKGDALERAKEALFHDKGAAALRFMLAISEPLRTILCNLVSKNTRWSAEHDTLLNGYLRVYLNHALGRLKKAKYSPAVARSRIIRRTNLEVLRRLQVALGKTAETLSSRTLGLPPVAAALLAKSKGEPIGLVREALELRSRAEVIRSELQELADLMERDDIEGQYELNRRISEWTDTVERELGLKTSPNLRDALEVHFVLGIPVPEILGSKLTKWIEHRLSARHLAVLTDITKRAAFYGAGENEYKKLVLKCVCST